MLKSVAQAMLNHLMSVYLLPKDLCERLSKSKMIGGLGFQRLYDFNLALIAKQGWRLLTAPNFLFARIYKARYFSENTFLDATLGSNPSFICSGIMKAHSLIRRNCIKSIGDGKETLMFRDPWLAGKTDAFVTGFLEDDKVDLCVADLIIEDRRIWDVPKLMELLLEEDVNTVCAIPLSTTPTLDKWCWRLESKCLFYVKSAYRQLAAVDMVEYSRLARLFWRRMWKLNVLPRVKNLL